jgi:uncharacterized protein (DUF169 family)
MQWSSASKQLVTLMGLKSEPIALSFCDEVPAGVKGAGRDSPSGCSYWKMAAMGEVFYTEPSDHYGCPIGAHTHGLPVGPEHMTQLGDMMKFMVGLEYIKDEEVSSMPTLQGGFRYAVYAPLAMAPVAPDVVLLRGNAKQLMLASEIARSVGMEATVSMRQRPTCAIIPEVLQSARSQSSFACIGNRVYTGLGDDEFYFAIPGSKLDSFVDKAAVIAEANRQLEAFHGSRVRAAAAAFPN